MEAIDVTETADDELAIMECLEDYHRILVQVARKTASPQRRVIALNRAQMVHQLIERLQELEAETH